MSIHINSIEELRSFLLEVKKLSEGDHAKNAFKIAYENDKKYYTLKKTEQNEELQEQEDEDEDQPDEEVPAKKEKITPSLDSLIRNINNLRAGQSFNRGEVRTQVADYFDGLSSDEQAALILFLRELAAVANENKTGQEAKEPDEVEPNTQASQAASEKPEAPKQDAQPERDQTGEDDSAPIRVSERQNLSYEKLIFEKIARS